MGLLHLRQSWPRFKEKEHKPTSQGEHGKVTLKDEHLGWFQPSLDNVVCQKHHVSVHVKQWNCIQVAAGGDQLLTTMTNLPCKTV